GGSHMKRLVGGLCAVLLLWGAGARGQTAGALSNGAAGLDELKKQFETSFRDLLRQEGAAAKLLQQRYLADLTALEDSLQAAGNQLSALLAVRSEKARFEQAGDIPDSAPSTGLPALQKLQNAWRAQTAGVSREQARKIVVASERYLQALANLQKALAANNNARSVDAVKAEKDRLLGNNRVREALALLQMSTPAPPASHGPATPPVKTPESSPVVPAATVVELGDYKFYPPGKEPPLKDLRPLRMDFPTADQRSAQFFYELRVLIMSDKSDYNVSRSSSYRSSSTTKSGSIANFPRITMASKNRELPEGCKLVIEYFSQPPARANALRRESVERIPLPAITRSQAYTVDAKGIRLSKYEYRDTHYGLNESSGRDFYGLIISVFDSGDHLLFQQCTPSTVAAQCTNKPAEPSE
ncbi:MAG: hypothetical protein NTV49_07750, partial [Kiritimatiellaeota bacterium]|nr:hypothetical protein [Kiritimatiellota bacterium]